MASDVIGVNSVFVSGKDTNYSDHLLENNILDEPLYENGEIIKKLLQANNKLSKSLMRIHEETLNPVKEENIYENITFNENKLNTINEIKNLKPVLKDDTNQEVKENASPKEILHNINASEETLESNKNVYTSTFSLRIGKPDAFSTEKSCEENELNFNINTSKMVERAEQSDDGSFKSSYAKSLIDSYRKSTPNIHTNTVTEDKTFVRRTVTQDFKTQNELDSIQIQPKVFGPVNLDGHSRLIEGLESKISSLTDNILLKDKELDKLRQELVFMKLECNRVKAENRSLKASLNNEISSRSLMLNNDGHPHSPVSSISSDSDTWTFQQQIMALNSQLEKAELSRHAYEAATKQLVHFLHTINSTLTTVGGSDANLQSPFTPQNTSELLTNLETTLMENRGRTIPPKIKTNPYFDNSRDGSYLAPKTDYRSHMELDRKSPFPSKTESNVSPSGYKEKENIRSTREDSRVEAKDLPPQPILAVCDRKEDAEAIVVNLKDVSFNKNKRSTEGKDEGKKRSSPQRRFSISQKIWNSTKRPLVRSGSVNNLPTELSYPRIFTELEL
ncbi:hypothetical protein Avbf_01914 [Armadillidium vulgare]|nr:hypothetical protein Avbf_01914 [Armadillidium vulgare]